MPCTPETATGRCAAELARPARGIVLEIDLQGARQVRETLPEAVRIFIEPPSFEALEERLRRRAADTPAADRAPARRRTR